jgi:hypothetical protein
MRMGSATLNVHVIPTRQGNAVTRPTLAAMTLRSGSLTRSGHRI